MCTVTNWSWKPQVTKPSRASLWLRIRNKGTDACEPLGLFLTGNRAKDRETLAQAEAIRDRRAVELYAHPEDRARADEHLDRCDGCSRYLDQIRETIRLTGTLEPEQIPEEQWSALLGAFHDWAGE